MLKYVPFLHSLSETEIGANTHKDDANDKNEDANEPLLKLFRLKLQKMLEKKQENERLAAELTKWKKRALKLRQLYRLRGAKTNTETTEIP